MENKVKLIKEMEIIAGDSSMALPIPDGSKMLEGEFRCDICNDTDEDMFKTHMKVGVSKFERKFFQKQDLYEYFICNECFYSIRSLLNILDIKEKSYLSDKEREKIYDFLSKLDTFSREIWRVKLPKRRFYNLIFKTIYFFKNVFSFKKPNNKNEK